MIAIGVITVLAALLVDQEGFRRVTLKKGIRVYHGTGIAESWEEDDGPEEPFWVSESRAVAEYFKTWNSDENPRVLIYELTEDIEDLVLISGPEEFARWMAHVGADPEGWDVQELAEDTCRFANGWIIEGNYPNGHDIMLCDASALKLVKSP